jgi:ribosomal protein S18 acetylase RimI-like enzyme
MAPVTFRRATAHDVPALVRLVQSAYRGEGSREGWTYEADLIEGQRTDEAMLAELLDRADTLILVAESDGLVACCELSVQADPTVAHFGMFAVDPTRQTKGLGRAVLEQAERTAVAEWGVATMRLLIIHLRDELIAWYERRGYHTTGETRPFPYGDERYGRPTRDDLHFLEMEKPLEADPHRRRRT